MGFWAALRASLAHARAGHRRFLLHLLVRRTLVGGSGHLSLVLSSSILLVLFLSTLLLAIGFLLCLSFLLNDGLGVTEDVHFVVLHSELFDDAKRLLDEPFKTSLRKRFVELLNSVPVSLILLFENFLADSYWRLHRIGYRSGLVE